MIQEFEKWKHVNKHTHECQHRRRLKCVVWCTHTHTLHVCPDILYLTLLVSFKNSPSLPAPLLRATQRQRYTHTTTDRQTQTDTDTDTDTDTHKYRSTHRTTHTYTHPHTYTNTYTNTKLREDGPGKVSGLCDDLLERCLGEIFLPPPQKKGEEGGFRWNRIPENKTKAQARPALENNNRKRCVVYYSNRSLVFLFYSRKKLPVL
jgi:hypothetical protein